MIDFFYVLVWETKEAFVCVESPYGIPSLANRWGYESFNICMINRRSNNNLYRVQNQHCKYKGFSKYYVFSLVSWTLTLIRYAI